MESPISHDLRGHKVYFLLHFFMLKIDKDERSLISMALAKCSGLCKKSLNQSCFVVAVFINLFNIMLTTLTWLANNTWKGFSIAIK